MRRVDNLSPLLILQDPDEAGQAKGTAALLARCLTRATLLVGDVFEPPSSMEGWVLLYPDTPGAAARAAPLSSSPTTLVVLDGTWRRSRRLLHMNPWLRALPRLALAAPPPSRYPIRRAQADLQRSTLEASALALARLDNDDARYAPLWSAMDDFIALHRQLAVSPRARVGSAAR